MSPWRHLHHGAFALECACMHLCVFVRVTQEAVLCLSHSLPPAGNIHFLLPPLVHSLCVHSFKCKTREIFVLAVVSSLRGAKIKDMSSQCKSATWPSFLVWCFQLCTELWTHGLSVFFLPVYPSMYMFCPLISCLSPYKFMLIKLIVKQKLKALCSCFLIWTNMKVEWGCETDLPL